MSQAEAADFDDLRSVAESLIHSTYRGMAYPRTGNVMSGSGGVQMHPAFDMTRTHSINLITEEFLGGYMQDGRMSVVRRFFCLFVTFDLIFISLLWLICIMINGDNIFQAFQKQILHYTIYTSLFDVVVAAICRFIVLIFFYALLYINHWLVIALSTSGSCLFLISKVFVFDWVDSHQQVLEVIIIITSFVIAWGEAWFLDCRVIPQERHASRYFSSMNFDRAPLIAPFLASQGESRPPESVANFYSPLDSAHNSDAEDELDDDYTRMGIACVENAYALLESGDWKMEKVTSKGDTIQSTQRDKVGKVYKLTGRLKYSAKALTEELFYKIEDMPKWNPTILESKIVRKINSYTDITYQATVGGGGGIVKSRDFVNLRCLRFFRNGKMSEDTDTHTSSDEGSLNRSCEGSVSTVSDIESYTPQSGSVNSSRAKFSTSSTGRLLNENNSETLNSTAFQTLSKSLGAKGFSTVSTMPPINFDEPPPLEENFEDAKDNLEETAEHQPALVQRTSNEKVWISAAISIDYPNVPPTTKYTRGENIVSGFAMREIAGKSDACIFEWIICLDLKGYIPRYVLDTTYTTFMTDYMTHLRKYVSEMRHRHRRVHKH